MKPGNHLAQATAPLQASYVLLDQLFASEASFLIGNLDMIQYIFLTIIDNKSLNIVIQKE